MDPAADLRPGAKARPFSRYHLRRAMRLSHCCVLLGLLGGVGVLALFFSVVSPDDDDIQQEFVQSNEPKHFATANYEAARDVRSVRTSTVRSALLTQQIRIIRYRVRARFPIVDEKARGTIRNSRTEDRSPPTKSSRSLLFRFL